MQLPYQIFLLQDKQYPLLLHVSIIFFWRIIGLLGSCMYCIIFCVILCNIEVFFLHYMGRIGAVAFYGAAALRVHPHVPPGEYLVIVLVSVVLLLFDK